MNNHGLHQEGVKLQDLQTTDQGHHPTPTHVIIPEDETETETETDLAQEAIMIEIDHQAAITIEIDLLDQELNPDPTLLAVQTTSRAPDRKR